MTTTRFLQFSKQFGKYCEHRFTPLSQRHGLSMREINVLLFLANNPGFDTARDITEYRGISKSQVSQAVDFLVELGKKVAESGMSFAEWSKANTDGVEKVAAKYF